jgi:hypothetical protein
MVTLLLGVWLALAPQNTGTIQGTVKRAGGSEGIGGVDITLRLENVRNSMLRTTSDAAGRFIFENLPPGKHTIQASREGYFAYPEGQPPVMVDFPQTQPLVLELVPGAVIGGRITDPQGRPLAGVAVSAMKLQYTEGRRSFGPGSIAQKTDDRGQYRLFWFAPGEYFIRAEYSSATLARRSYYPGTVDSNAAASFVIRGGESLDAMDFSLPAANSIRISGRVRIDGPGPVSGSIRTFFLLPLDGRPTEQFPAEFSNTLPQQLGQTSNDFALEVRGLAPGSYDLAPFFLDAANGFHTGRTRIDIGDRDIENVTAYVSPDIEVTGRIALSGDPTPKNWSPFFLQLRARDATVPLTNRSNSATIAPDGAFSIRNVVEGRYQLYIGAIPGSLSSDLYISGIRQGGVDIRDEGTVDVRPYTPPIEITVSTGTGKIHGVAEGRAHVVLVPQLSRRKNVMFYDRVVTDAKGEFRFEGIAPGEYKVFAFEELPDTAEQNPEFIARYETLGQSVTVNSGATVETRVRVLRLR